MTNQQFKTGRVQARLTQMQAAQRLRLSQPYLSQLERSERPITPELARLATKVYGYLQPAFRCPRPRHPVRCQAPQD